jgi:tetratricopeptide (TPR) repeat protein
MRPALRTRLFIVVAAAAALLAPPAAAAGPRAALAEGFTLFAAGDYDGAARSFEQAAAAAAGDGLDPGVARYDLGLALLKAGKGPEATAAFADALRSPDPGLGAKAHYNRGLALVAGAEAAEAAGSLQAAVGILDQALGSFEGAIRAAPGDEDPKVNHELVARKKARLEAKILEQQRQRGGGGPPPRAQEPPPAGGQGAQREPPREPGNEMRPDEARTMLDAMKQQEMSQRARVRPPRGASAQVDRPW